MNWHPEDGGPPRPKSVDVIMSGGDDDPFVTFEGTMMCKGKNCPVCGYGIRIDHAARVKKTVAAWRRAGGEVVNLTLTIRHENDELALLIEILRAAWDGFSTGAWRRLAKVLGIEHHIHAHDATFGRSGWHAHLHSLLYIDGASSRALSARSRARAIRDLRAHWIASVTRALLSFGIDECEHARYLPSIQRALRFESSTGSGDYLVKLGVRVAEEPARRSGRQALSPNAIMQRAASGDKSAQALWQEYTHATLGLALVPGLARVEAALARTRTIPAEPTATAPATTPTPAPARTPPTRRTVATIPGDIFGRVSRVHGGRLQVRLAARRDGLRGVATVIAAMFWRGRPGDPSPPESWIAHLMSVMRPRRSATRRASGNAATRDWSGSAARDPRHRGRRSRSAHGRSAVPLKADTMPNSSC